MDTTESFEEGTLIAKSTNSRKKKNNFSLKIGPKELTAELPADWLDGENINNLLEEWAVNTYDLFRFLRKKYGTPDGIILYLLRVLCRQ
jgi:hypothetical protein